MYSVFYPINKGILKPIRLLDYRTMIENKLKHVRYEPYHYYNQKVGLIFEDVP